MLNVGGFDGSSAGGGDGAISVPKFTLTMDGRASTTQSIPLTAPASTANWVSGVISVRLHEKSWTTGTATPSIVVQNVVQTPDDPSVIYAADLTSVQIAVADAAPKLYTTSLSTPIGPMLRLLLKWDQGATATTALTFAISIDVVGRNS